MADVNERDAKLIQYLNEAYGKERELETALQAHIGMTTRAPYKKRLQQHLKETKSHARQVERRIKQLGGTAEAVDLPGPGAVGQAAGKAAGAASKAVALAKGPMHALRGTGEQDKLLHNAQTEYSEEHQEIAKYAAIETLAEAVGDKETAKMAKAIRREEERMASYLERLIPTLTKAVATAEIPAAQRNGGRSRRRSSSRSRSRSTSSQATRSRATSSSRSSASRARSGGSRTTRAKSGSRSSS